MARMFHVRVQIALVILLFLGSLAVLVYNTMVTLALPQRELEAQNQLQAASREMAQEASPVGNALKGKLDPDAEAIDAQLRAISQSVLKKYPAIEGGFYSSLDNRFCAYAFPTGEHAEMDPTRNEPPPLETPLIRRLMQQVLDSGEPMMRTEYVESSRVVVLTEPVGDWPAALAIWLMMRLTGPRQLQAQLRQTELSSYLALGGVGLSLVLTCNLGRTLSRQRRAEQRLRDELRRAEHLAGLGKLLAGVAHEIRNPLAAIRSTVQLWQRQPVAARTPESLDAVVHGVDRLGAIVSRLLLFSRVDNAERKPVNMNQLLAETWDLVQAQASEQGVHLEQALSDPLPPVLGSANALRQVILNLTINALQAMPRGGCLKYSTAHRPNDKRVELVVSDTGPGVSVEDQRHLFEPFFTTRAEGTGLGLALCREIVANHGGTIEYLPKEQPGAAFRILLPIAET